MKRLFKAIATGMLMLCASSLFADSKSSFPDPGTITNFSLGNAHFKPFAKRPTAQELYDTVKALYRSFDSVAVSIQWREKFISSDSVTEDGKILDVVTTEDSRNEEYRYVAPDKLLMVKKDSSDHNMAGIDNGEHDYIFNSKQQKWEDCSDWFKPDAKTLDKKKTIDKDWILSMLSQTPQTTDQTKQVSISGFRLLPDGKIGKTDVYVLEMIRRSLPRKDKAGKPIPTSTPPVRLYIGKNDLLIRKVSISDEDPRFKKQGLTPCSDVWMIMGFQANLKLPESLFMPN